jgi:hypothetical protein
MSDIFMTLPWNCGERNCPVGWHLSNYWISDDGYTVDQYGDGDHESVDADDLPSSKEHEDAWRSYWQHVADTGEDPLGELGLRVKEYTVSTPLWRIQLQKGITEVVLVAASRNGRRCTPSSLPPEVMDYMEASRSPGGAITTSLSWGELSACPEITLSRRFPSIIAVARFQLPIKKPRPKGTIQRERRTRAKELLA